jgi:ribosomal protein L11 methyltransferase
MKSMSVHLAPEADSTVVWKELELSGLNVLYSSQEDGQEIIFATAEVIPNLSHIKNIAFVAPYELPEIDWVQQFHDHGMNFHEGYVHVDLKEFGCSNPLFNPIKLKPGPGFGDLSHPTTKLVLKMMSRVVKHKHVIDVGCGSGILTLAAASMQSASCYGLDIDKESICHSILNAKLNKIESQVSFGKASDYKLIEKIKSLVILMNMIESEQKQAWDSLRMIHNIPGMCLISGILKEDRDRYLAWTKTLNWQLISEIEMDGWIGLLFSRS